MVSSDKVKEVKELLKEMFQFEQSDLDFGIYRIMNIKRNEIQKFIDEDLIKTIETEFSKVKLEENVAVKEELNTLKIDLEETFGEDIESIVKNYSDKPKVKKYIDKKEELKSREVKEEKEIEIYDEILAFFSRYYDKGDFISKRRYSTNNFKYAIPYNGEEVMLHWANNDQYYIKTAENFNYYSFKAKSLKVEFKIENEEDVELEKNNNKSNDKRFFIVKYVNYDASNKLLVVYFKYESPTIEEEKEILELVDKKNVSQDFANEWNLKQINDKIAIYGLKELSEKAENIRGEKLESSILKFNLNKYTKKNTSDYFIHKNLNEFLKRELDFYIKNEVLHLDDIGTSKEMFNVNLEKIKVFKEISLKIIDFLSQIEEFQKMLWEKKKFVIENEYCITLDYIDEKFYSKIIENQNQLNDWKELFSFDIEEELKKQKSTLNGHNGENTKIQLLKNNPTLTIDTKHFDEEFKYELLSTIDDLEEKTNGILISSENFQALNLLQYKYKEKIDCCYIDPPYNTGTDGFLYKDNFYKSSWSSFIDDRIKLSKNYLSNNGLIFVSIDDNEIAELKLGLDKIFNSDNLMGIIHWRKNRKPHNAAETISKSAEFILCYANKEKIKLVQEYTTKLDEDGNNVGEGPIFKADKQERIYEFPSGIKCDINDINLGINTSARNPRLYIEYLDKPIINDGILQNKIRIKGRYCLTNERADKKLNKAINEGRIYINSNGVPKAITIREDALGKVQTNLWVDKGYNEDGNEEIKNLFGVNLSSEIISHPKPVKLTVEILKSYNNLNLYSIDYFAGSGTTGHSVLTLNKIDGGNRKFILVEMGTYFNSVTKPRIQKVIYSENWKDGKPINNDGHKKQIIKYQILEQYEDTLNNIDFKQPNSLATNSKDYLVKYMLSFESRENNVFLNLEHLTDPFNYKLKFIENDEVKEKSIDLVETFNYIANVNVSSISLKKDGDRKYKIVKGLIENRNTIIIWRDLVNNFDEKKDKEFVEKEILTEEFEEIYVNSNSVIKGAKILDDIFKAKLFN